MSKKVIWGIGILVFVLSVGNTRVQDLQTAIRMYQSEQFTAAATEFKKLVKQEPGNGDNYFY